MSQASASSDERYPSLLLPFIADQSRTQRRPGEAEEFAGLQLFLGGCELPTDVNGAVSTLRYRPGVPANITRVQ